MSLFIADAFADTAANVPQQASMLSSVGMLVAFILIFYFLMWRPQSKRMKEHRQLIANLQKGDEVITSGGVVGTISKVAGDFIILTVAQGVDITVQRPSVASVLPKGTLKSLS